MVNIFGKKTPNIKTNSEFQESFTKEQKAAIIVSLLSIARSDGNIHRKEMRHIEQTSILLGIELDDPVFKTFETGGFDFLIKILNSLQNSQKEWYVITVHSLIAADGKLHNNEIKYAHGFCKDIGISEDEYDRIIQKADLIMKKFM